MYRVTNITSNIGTSAPDVFKPYDHKSESALAEVGVTYTVRAMVEFTTEGIIQVYAIGFDGDVATVTVAASKIISMPYSVYHHMRQDYIGSDLGTLAVDPAIQADALGPEKWDAGDLLDLHPPLSSLPPTVGSSQLTESAMQATFGAIGTIMTENATGELVPVHGISVCVYDASPVPYPLLTLLNTTAGEPACSYTDASGMYTISDVNGVDPYDMGTAADVSVIVTSLGYDGAIDLRWYNPNDGYYRTYFNISNPVPNYNGQSLVTDFNFHDGDPDDRGMAGAARIIDAISDGMAFFEAYGQDPADLTVLWNHMDGTSVFPDAAKDGAFYDPVLHAIFLDGNTTKTNDYSRSRYTILHEFGHHVHNVHDPRFDFACSPHYIDIKYDEACAWGEGWAGLVPHLVDGGAEMLGVGGIKINIETGHEIYPSRTFAFGAFEASGRPIGEKVEGSVAAAMWDMVDAAVDPDHDSSQPGRPRGDDNLSTGVDRLLDVFFGGTYDNFADFYDRWEIDMRHDSAESIAILHGMSFAIPSNMSYYGLADELDGIFKHRISFPLQFESFSDELRFYSLYNLMQFKPNYVDISDDGSTAAITSTRGLGLQMIDAHTGGHKGLYATYGHSHLCTLEEDPLTCINSVESRMLDLRPVGFSSMNGVTFGHNSTMVLVSDGHQNRIHALGSHGGYFGQFGTGGDGDGELNTPDGIAFLDNTTVAIADAANNRIQTFVVADDGSAQHDDQFTSYNTTHVSSSVVRQQLAAGDDGTLYAAGYAQPGIPPSIWIYPPPNNSSTATRIDDPSLCNLGGIGVDGDGLIYVSDPNQGRIRIYDPDNLRGSVNSTTTELDGRPMTLRQIQDDSGLVGCSLATSEAFIDEFGSRGSLPWQLRNATGVALGTPDGRTGDVRVYVADQNGVKIYEKDRAGPHVVSVWSHTPDGTVVQGDTVEIAINFSERVTVTGMPLLALDTGVEGSNASYVSGSGSRTLTFNHTIGASAGPSYIDYEGAESLSLSGGRADPSDGIVDGSGNAANLTLPGRGTAASLATNAALWIDRSRADAAPFEIASADLVAAVEHRQVVFNVAVADGSIPAALDSYSMIGSPEGAAISHNGTFTWTPNEAQDGMHAFVVRASAQGDLGERHARTFHIQVAEDNMVPDVESVPDRRAAALSEVRFDIVATDADVPAQNLEYWLVTNTSNNYAVVLPNGTFMWTPSEYNIGTTAFNVTVFDGFVSDGDSEQDAAPFVEFSVMVGPPSSPLRVYVLDSDRPRDVMQGPVYAAGQTIRIAVDFSEPVVVQSGHSGGTPYLELRTGAAGMARASYDSGSGTKTLVFAYEVRNGDATGRLSYAGTGALALNGSTITVLNSGEVASTALPETGSLGSLSDSSLVRIDAVRPAVESVYALAGDGTYGEGAQVDIAARFSENVIVAGSPAITLETGATDRDAMYLSGNSTDTLVFRYAVQAGDNASRLDYTGTDALRAGAGGFIRDGVGNNAVLALPTPSGQGSLGYNSNITIGIAVMNETADNSVTLNIGRGGDTGLISVIDSGDEARIMLNLRGVAGPGGSGTATFPSDGVTVSASFASVTFAPGATAMSVPTNNVLVLYVADGVLDNSSVQRVLGYDGPNPVVLQRVVEIGDEDARIEFDAPVRISLEGLAGGRAFYVEGAGGAITPIDRACAADDLQRVQRQLDGAGECQMDSDGGDKIIYTYHLTRFGTVLSESGTPAVPDHTCSMRLALSSLGVEDARPGVDSPAASQTVVNSGSLPFDRIELEATPWYVDLGGAAPGPDTRSLNASITEVREEEGGAYRTVYSSGTAVADGLGGGLEAPLWFRLNLAAYDDVHGVDLTQYVTYVAECGGPAGQR